MFGVEKKSELISDVFFLSPNLLGNATVWTIRISNICNFSCNISSNNCSQRWSKCCKSTIDLYWYITRIRWLLVQNSISKVVRYIRYVRYSKRSRKNSKQVLLLGYIFGIKIHPHYNFLWIKFSQYIFKFHISWLFSRCCGPSSSNII